MKRSIGLVLLGLILSCGLFSQLWTAPPALLDARDLNQIEIFAYRDWQDTGTRLEQGQRVTIHAQGSWLYTPNEWNGPEGHRRYRAPSFYPLPDVPGGALIGRIGETGKIFYVGANLTFRAPAMGELFLRIDDDILTDNQGKLQAAVQAAPVEQTTDD